MIERRTALRDIFCCLGLALSGCTLSPPSSIATENGTTVTPAGDETETGVDTINRYTDPERLVSDWHGDPVLGGEDPLEHDQAIADRSSQTTDDLGFECRTAAVEGVARTIDERLDDPTNVQVIAKDTSSIEGTQYERRGECFIHAGRIFTAGDDEIVERPDVSFAEFRAATPRSVTMSFEGDPGEHTCEYDVYVYDVLEWLD